MINLSSYGYAKFRILSLVAFTFITACAPFTSSTVAESAPTMDPTQENGVFIAHGTPDPEYLAEIDAMRNPDVPALPFPDNPDPSLCEIPTQ